ncbi:MAG: hypothetical protein M1834_002779 [Cirrosporium novae-zelandiae]|nr:MAG: hypothetical protein M1834_002779 [Cirrosporium novae-zelandiae]
MFFSQHGSTSSGRGSSVPSVVPWTLEDQNTSADDSEIQEQKQHKSNLIRARKRVEDLRSQTLQARLKVREVRTSLRRKRELVAQADIALLQVLKAFSVSADSWSWSSSNLPHLVEQSQETHDAYLEEENLYNDLENQLDRDDFKLDQAEKHFYQKYAELLSNIANHRSVPENVPYDSYSVSTSTVDDYRRREPPVVKYLSRVGDETIVMEQIMDLRKDRAEHVARERRWDVYNIPSNQTTATFLDDFDRRHKHLQDELSIIGADVRRLRSAATDPLLVHLGGAFDPSDLEADEPLPNPDELKRHSLLLPMEDTNFVFVHPQRESPHSKTTSFRNDWFLHLLRTSSLEIVVYKSFLDPAQLELEDQALTHLVLTYWNKEDILEGGKTGSHSYSVPDSDESIGFFPEQVIRSRPRSRGRLDPSSLHRRHSWN